MPEAQTLSYVQHDPKIEKDEPPQEHIIKALCREAGIIGEILVRPHIYIETSEKKAFEQFRDCVVIQSTGLGARKAMRNKEWFPERFQAVVDGIRDLVQVVQIGSEEDPKLSGCVDMRGKTTIRGAAAVLAQARLFVGLVGFLMHLARSVNCEGVIIYGGREAPWQSGYICNTNLYTQIPCSPCWYYNRCDHEKKCMREITAEKVISIVRQKLAEPKTDLAVEKAFI